MFPWNFLIWFTEILKLIFNFLNRNFTLKRMPVPFNDVTACMRLNAEKTETALKKVTYVSLICTVLTP